MTLEQEKQNLENRLKEIEKELEKEPKVGDVCWFWYKDKQNKTLSVLDNIDGSKVNKYETKTNGYINCEKITDPYVINFVKGVKKYTIEDLRNGVCAVKNDGTLEELIKVLKKAFPKDSFEGVLAEYIYYFQNKYLKVNCGCCDTTNLPTQSVKDFL